MPGTQMSYHIRKQQILEGALRAAQDKGYQHITQKDIATHAGISTGLITYHFGNMDALRSKIMEFAIAKGNLKVLAQGIVAGDPIALTAPDSAKSNAIASLSNA